VAGYGVAAHSTHVRLLSHPEWSGGIMQIRRLTTALLVGLLLTLTLGTVTAAAAPPPLPTETGCPAGYQVLVVSDLVAMGYLVLPETIDAEGNQDNLICGLPLPEPVRQQLCGPDCPIPVTYIFDENDLPAQQ
jgi:hypothetical protein